MTDIMYEIPSRDDVEKCVITKATIEGTAQPTMIYKTNTEKQNDNEASAS